jgi:hypothetical protein
MAEKKPANLTEALIVAQSEMAVAFQTKVNPHFKSDYAPIEEVIKAVKQPLNDNGIFVLQRIHLADKGQCVETEFHGYGEVLKCGKVYVPADKMTPQGYGSALTYAKRYSLQTACCLPTGDDDGNYAEETTKQANDNDKLQDVPDIMKDLQETFDGDLVIEDAKEEKSPEVLFDGIKVILDECKTIEGLQTDWRKNSTVIKSIQSRDKKLFDKLVEYKDKLKTNLQEINNNE